LEAGEGILAARRDAGALGHEVGTAGGLDGTLLRAGDLRAGLIRQNAGHDADAERGQTWPKRPKNLIPQLPHKGPHFFFYAPRGSVKKRRAARLADDGIPDVDIVIRKNLGANCVQKRVRIRVRRRIQREE
jgi:hypothetical protein